MKSLWQKRNDRAFTLVEMLVVIAIIAVLAALLLPALVRGKQRAQRIQCISNLKQMGTAFQMFAHDHQGRFPTQTPQAEGGSEEYVVAGNNIPGLFYFSYRHLQTLANELVVPRVLVCPADQNREPALSFGVLQNSNVSYFVAVSADYNTASSVLAGDRNIANDANTVATLLRGYGLHWTSELHFFKGNVLFSDAHVEQMNNPQVELTAGTAPNTTIVLPTVTPPVTSPGNPGSSPGPGPSPDPVMAQAPGITIMDPNIEAAPEHASAPRTMGSQSPTPAPRMAPRNAMAGSQMTGRAGAESSTPITSETHARETNGAAAVRAAAPIAAPAPVDDDVAPSIRMLASARAYIATTSWWLWLVLVLLLLASAYLFLSKKKQRPARRRNQVAGRRYYTESDDE
jgi:prepilin-type N-terminal cleavage/methylation domain-containing protein